VVRWLLFPLLCGLCLFAAPSPGRADGQYSLRNLFEVGKRFSEREDEIILPAGLRGEAMFGPPRHRAFRFGPALELRTADFASLEAALGVGVLVPTGDFAFNLNGLIGYAERKQAPDGAVGIGTLSWGYRGYNYHSWYGYGLSMFVSARHSLTGDDVLEITGGIEVDVLFTTIIPVLFIKNLFTSDDPHDASK
jgi:hypothetical protein